MKITTIEVSGFASTFKALRLPFGKECRSEIEPNVTTFKVAMYMDGWDGEEVNAIEHRSKVYPHPKDIALLSTLIKRGDEHAKVARGILVYAEITSPVYWWSECETYFAGHQRLCSESTMHIDCRGLQGEELQKAKADIPMGKELTKIDFFSYQCLRNIYKQRKDHRLPEWHEFIEWIKTLPFADELILCEKSLEVKE